MRLRLVGWVLSAALMGVGGGLWAQYNIAFGPRAVLLPADVHPARDGRRRRARVRVRARSSGAAIVTALTEIVRRVEENAGIPGLTQMAVALLILLVLYRRPQGLVGPVELHTRIGRRLAARGRRQA